MEYLTWNDVLAREGVSDLFPMHYRPNKQNEYSVFLISSTPGYMDIHEVNREIDYKGTAVTKWINDNFYCLANSKISSETIKVYHKIAPDQWISRGFYKLAAGSIKRGNYRFRLVPARNVPF